MKVAPTLVWFRLDLRLQDNPALRAALARGGPAIPVYIRDDAGEGGWAPGGASRWWLHHSLAALDETLRRAGSRLVFACGDSLQALRRWARETGAAAVCWNDRREPAAAARDEHIAAVLRGDGLEVRRFRSGLLFEPSEVRNKSGRPFQVFTPFWRRCVELPVTRPTHLDARMLAAPPRWPRSADLRELDLLPTPRWDAGLAATWQPGEAEARRRLRRFAAKALAAYHAERDRPDREGTSGLSPHLHFGEITPRQIWAAVSGVSPKSRAVASTRGAQIFLKEVGWREFAHHLLYHFPDTPERPLRREFGAFPWRRNREALRAWRQGRTGFPVVDAGMRQLWQTGWMHNRLRMIAASFLVKDLRLSWREGAAWFWDKLVDADLANNTLGWQWAAGCGADAAPFFRIFSPELQGRRHDPEGAWVRRWVPELAALPTRWIHAPWTAPGDVLARAGVKLGQTYPRPLVDHRAARRAALAAYHGLASRRQRRRPECSGRLHP